MESPTSSQSLANDIRSFSRFGPTLKTAIRTVCDATILPLFLMIVAWQMAPAYELMTLKGSVHHAILVILPMLLMSTLLLHTFRVGGLAEDHFGWPRQLCHGIHSGMLCVIWLVLPLKFFCEALETFQNGAWYDSLGRMFFIATLTATSIAFFLAARGFNLWRDAVLEARGLARTRAQRRQHRENLLSGGPVDVDMLGADSWISGSRKLTLLLISLLPMVLVGLSVAGYHFTAMQMTRRIIWTVLLTGMIAVATGLISRMLLVTQFRVKLRQLKRNESGHIGEDESIDIADISSQVNRLLRATAIVAVIVTAWQIWSEVSPTIRFLDSVTLWENTRADGQQVPTTGSHALMGFGLLCITWVLSRNLPGLLELTLIDRLPLDRGGRYAISFVVRYLVGLMGILLACKIVGFSWNSVQWLAGALALGLGFGLQEIFANLVSGIIILIERPVRVGDFVTINGTTGHVSQMQLRATTIRDLDMRELIIPNKKFITDDVMNWTLSDKMSRLIIKVGVAYESDTKMVQEALLTVARRHPLVLQSPAPQVIFEQFGDSTLDFDLRVMVTHRDLFPKVRHELNMAINEEFHKKDIEIAFPQREIRVKTDAEANAIVGERKAG